MEKKNESLVINFKPYEIQQKVLNKLYDKKTRIVYFTGGAGSSKSYLLAAFLILEAISWKGTNYLVGRHTAKDFADSTFKTFRNVLNDFGLIESLSPGSISNWNGHFKFYEYKRELRFINGSVIYFKDLKKTPRDPDYISLGSREYRRIAVDEASQLEGSVIPKLESRIRQKGIGEKNFVGKLLICSNPINYGWLYDVYKRYTKNELFEHEFFITSSVNDNPHFNDSNYISTLSSFIGSDYERLYRGSFEYSSEENALFDPIDVEACFRNQHYDDNDEEYYISFDLAGKGINPDSTVIVIWKGLRIIDIIKLVNQSQLTINDLIVEKMRYYGISPRNVIGDAGGIGQPLVKDILKVTPYLGGMKPMNDENFSNLRTQCYFKLAELIRDRKIHMGENYIEEIVKELAPIKKIDTDKLGTIKITKKEDVVRHLGGRSPDFADAIVMRIYFLMDRKRGFYVPRVNKQQRVIQKMMWDRYDIKPKLKFYGSE